jgi:hypothetical protein
MYRLEFTLHAYDTSAKTLESALAEFTEELEIADSPGEPGMRGEDFILSMKAEDPTAIFDICAQFGRIKSIKVDEI